MQHYRNEPMGELAKQLAGGLLRLRKGYVDDAEALLSLVKPNIEYPYEFVVFRLTGYRPPQPRPIQPLSGESLRDDLRRLILDVCDSFDLRASDYAEPVLDIEALARRLGISTKTLQRWRRQGLVARRMVFADGQRRIAFLESSLRRFAERRREQLLRAMRFSQMGAQERDDLLRRAARMARCRGATLHEICRRLARRTGRAIETIRYTIRRHDRQCPRQAIFPAYTGALDDQAKQIIYRCFLEGVSIEALAQRFGRTRGSLYRAINEMRLRQLGQRKIEYVYNPQFDLPSADADIMGDVLPPAPVCDPPPRPAHVADDLPPYLKALYDVPLLTAAQERRLFQQYNYVKFKADQARSALGAERVSATALRRIERLLVQAEAIKHRIIRANLRLVVSIAKKHLRGPQSLAELISDGNISLMKAVEKFDYARGFRFSTYASWAIMKNFARTVPAERYRCDRARTGEDELLDVLGGLAGYDAHAPNIPDLRDSLDVVLAQLSPRERSIVVGHYGLEPAEPGRTLEQISRQMGISKERVRQIERKAMEKLRTMLKPVQSDLL